MPNYYAKEFWIFIKRGKLYSESYYITLENFTRSTGSVLHAMGRWGYMFFGKFIYE